MGRRSCVLDGASTFAQVNAETLHSVEDEVLLRREVVEDRLLGDLGDPRDLLDSDGLEPAVGEEAPRGFLDCLARPGLLALR
jgi:hypothetical protein